METRNRRCRRIRSNYSFGADPLMFTQAIYYRGKRRMGNCHSPPCHSN